MSGNFDPFSPSVSGPPLPSSLRVSLLLSFPVAASPPSLISRISFFFHRRPLISSFPPVTRYTIRAAFVRPFSCNLRNIVFERLDPFFIRPVCL